MSDELKRLGRALRAATPEPDEAAKARALALAQRNFAARQGSGEAGRHRDTAPEGPAGFLDGARKMFEKIGMRPALLVTTSIAVVGLFAILPPRAPVGIGPAPVAERETFRFLEETAPAGERSGVISLSEQAPAGNQPLVKKSAPVPSPAPVAGFYADGSVEPSPPDNERFANGDPNPLKITSESPVSTFSIDVDTASYAYIRSAIMGGRLPEPDAVRIEEMVNYFPYDYAQPRGEVPFSTDVAVFPTPWNAGTKLVRIGIQGEMPAVGDRPPLDLVFLIDTSGSMQDANKLPLLKQGFRLLLNRLNPGDRIAIVTYAGASGLVLEPTPASERGRVLAALDRLEAGGSTAGESGLRLAYATAERMAGEGRVGRILLATDGDFNVGISDPEALKRFVEEKRESGTYLSVLGFGRGNYNDALMQALAQNGNGTAAYIDTLNEAQKVLVDQVAGALFTIASDVKIQVEFNPATVAEYRLIGYETRLLAREDFANDKVDAGDIGAGHSVTALYEITPVGSDAVRNAPLRYAPAANGGGAADEFGFLRLRYKMPGESESRLIETPIPVAEGAADDDARFAAAIAGFGQLLRGGKYLGDWGYEQAIELAGGARGEDAFGYRAEAVKLMRLARSLAR